jgi:PAS domain S-box-containing protein
LSRIKIQESEERYRFLFDSNPLPMWVFDLETLRFLSVNKAAVNHYGYSEKEFLSMSLKDIRLPEDLPVLAETVAKIFQESGKSECSDTERKMAQSSMRI